LAGFGAISLENRALCVPNFQKLQGSRKFSLGKCGKGHHNDDLAFEALSQFPVGVKPDFCFMNRRSLEQLRKSRTNVTSPTGMPTIPDSVAGIPIVVTDSVVNTEA